MKIKAKRFDKKIPLPSYEKKAAGFDFICRKAVTFGPKEIKFVPANIACEIPEGYMLLVFPRSSTASKIGLMLANSVGVVDPYYCGDDNEIALIFYNLLDKKVIVKRGDRIAQGIIVKYEKAEFHEVKKLLKGKRESWGKSKKLKLLKK